MIRTQSSTLSLRPGYAVPLPDGGRLEVLAGRVWLTRTGDLDDHWLGAGESIAIEPDSGPLVEAWGGSARLGWSPVGVLARVEAGLRHWASRLRSPVEHNAADAERPFAGPCGVAGPARRGAAGAA